MSLRNELEETKRELGES